MPAPLVNQPRHPLFTYAALLFSVSSERLAVVHIDTVRPLPSCQRFNYWLTRFDSTPDCLPDIRATREAAAFIAAWASEVSCPTIIDRGRQFQSPPFHELLHLLGKTHLCTAACLTKTNGLVQSFHRHLKAAITAQDTPS